LPQAAQPEDLLHGRGDVVAGWALWFVEVNDSHPQQLAAAAVFWRLSVGLVGGGLEADDYAVMGFPRCNDQCSTGPRVSISMSRVEMVLFM